MFSTRVCALLLCALGLVSATAPYYSPFMFGANPYLLPFLYGGFGLNNVANQTATPFNPFFPLANTNTAAGAGAPAQGTTATPLNGAAYQNAYAGLYFNNFFNQTQQPQQQQAQIPAFGFPAANQTTNPFAWYYLPWIRWYYCIQPMYYGMPPHPQCFPPPAPAPTPAPADPSIATPAGGADAAQVPPSFLAMFPQMFARPMLMQQQQMMQQQQQQQQQQMAMFMNPFAMMMQQQQPQEQQQQQEEAKPEQSPFDYAALVPNKGIATVM